MATKTKTKKKRLTKIQMRVAIAKDVIAQINSKKLIPETGVWIYDPKLGSIDDHIDNLIDKAMEDEKNDTCRFEPFNARDFTKKVNKCKVCALGSIFVSAVNLYDDVELKDGEEAASVFETLDLSPLSKYFSPTSLAFIECCFEGEDSAHWCDIDGKESAIAIAYHRSFRLSKERLIAIMKNIVRNKGEFIAEQDLTKEMLIENLANMIM